MYQKMHVEIRKIKSYGISNSVPDIIKYQNNEEGD